MSMESVAARHDVSGFAAVHTSIDPLASEQAITALQRHAVPRRPSTSAPASSPVRGVDDPGLFVPPEPVADDVDARSAEEALQQVMAALTGARVALEDVSNDKDMPWTLRMLGKTTGSMMQFASTVLSPDAAAIAMQGLQNEFIADRVRYTMDSIREQRKAMAYAMEQKNRKEEEALQKQKETERKATKGQIICVVVSWASSALQVGMGMFKLATGQPTGMLDVVAGACGMVRSALETVVMTHPDSRGQLQHAIDKMAKAELAVGVAGNTRFRTFITKAVSTASIEKMVEDSLWAAARIMGKECTDLNNVALVQKWVGGAYFEAFRNQLNRTIAFAVARVGAAISAPMALARALKGSYDVANGINTLRGAEGTAAIAKLMTEVSILEFMMRQIQSQLKDLKKGMERETDEHTQHTAQITRHVQDQIQVKLGIADSMQALGAMA